MKDKFTKVWATYPLWFVFLFAVLDFFIPSLFIIVLVMLTMYVWEVYFDNKA